MTSIRLRRANARLLLIILFVSTLAGLAGQAARAQPAVTSQAAKIHAALGDLVAGSPAQTTPPDGAARSTRPVYAMEGPRTRNPGRALPGGLPVSLADRRDAKGLQRLTLGASAGAPGDSVTLIGRGYAPGRRVDLFWDGVNVTERQLILADADGRFSWGFRVPSPAVDGAHTIAASEASAGTASLAAAGDAVSEATFNVRGGLPTGTTLPAAAPQKAPPVVTAPASQPTLAATKPWTFAVYLAGDNSLSTFADLNLSQMVKAGGTNANVNIVALADQVNKPTKYYEVTAGGLVDRTPATITGNIDTGSTPAFVNFMGWVAQNYPAQRYGVVVWDHGGGWSAVESDDPTGNSWDMTELRQALQAGLQQLGRPKYDLLLFDACMMAQYEVVLQIQDLVDVLVASEQSIPGSGTPYDAYLGQTLVPNGASTPEALGAAMVTTYTTFYANNSNARDFTLTEMKLGAPFAALSQQIDAFANALLAAGPTSAGEIQLAHDATQVYAYKQFLDLGDFAKQIKAKVNNPTVQQAADNLLAALAANAGLVLRETHGPKAPGSTGLTVYLPAASDGYGKNYDNFLVKGTPWHTFVNAFFTGKYPDATPPVDTPPAPPPPVTASASDIVYTARVSPDHFDLNRIQSVASSDQNAPTLTLLSDGFRNTYPRWSPDGKLVAYVSDRGVDPATKTGLEMNLFLVKADGTPLDGAKAPTQLTKATLNCPDGPGAGTTCVVEQAYDPSWAGDSVSILYTLLHYDLSAYPNVQVQQSIRLIDLSASPITDDQILPGAGLGSDVTFSNADFNGSLFVFTYSAPASYGANFAANNIGFIDFSVSPPLLSYFALNSAAERASGNYVIANYPALRPGGTPGTSELAFLYTRVGNPAALTGIDPRTPPPAGQLENPYDTYDIGRMQLAKVAAGYKYTMFTPIWPFPSPEKGEGVSYRPSWRPDDSGNLTASYSTDGGYTYDVGLFLNNTNADPADDRGFLITSDGYSYLPSWGAVAAADVKARLEVKPAYLEPGPGVSYYLAGTGFASGEQVQITQGGTAVTTAAADAQGAIQVKLALPKGSPVGPLKYTAKGLTSARTSNEGVLVVLAPRNTGAPAPAKLYLPLLAR